MRGFVGALARRGAALAIALAVLAAADRVSARSTPDAGDRPATHHADVPANPHRRRSDPWEMPIAHLTFKGDAAWLVIGEALRDERLAAVRAGERIASGVAATPLRTDHFANLRAGYVVLVYGGFATRAPAVALAAALRARGIETNVKRSGSLKPARPGARSRLVRLWGVLGDDMKHPAKIEISGDVAASAFTGSGGTWQAWLLLDAGTTAHLQLIAELGPPPRASCTPGDRGGWFDLAQAIDVSAETRDLYVDWSPTPDCNGE